MIVKGVWSGGTCEPNPKQELGADLEMWRHVVESQVVSIMLVASVGPHEGLVNVSHCGLR
jgi:hypothetical protein